MASFVEDKIVMDGLTFDDKNDVSTKELNRYG